LESKKSNNMLYEVKRSFFNFDEETTTKNIKLALEHNVSPLKIINSALTPSINDIGDRFAKGEAFLPELVLGGNLMKKMIAMLRSEIEFDYEEKKVGKLVIGTVKGDLHDIGKTLVATMFEVNNFEVIDLGVDVSPDVFIDSLREHKPEFLGLSCLLATTIIGQRVTIGKIKEAGVRDSVKILVGGSPVTEKWAEEIGADGYADNAIEAINLAKTLLRNDVLRGKN